MAGLVRSTQAHQIRAFSNISTHFMPLQPAKQRKTTPFKNPRRPHLIDPIQSDQDSLKFRLRENPNVMFIVREPSSIPNIDDGIIGLQDLRTRFNSKDERFKTGRSITRTDSETEDKNSGLFHPILSDQQLKRSQDSSSSSIDLLPPPVRNPSKSIETKQSSLTPESLMKLQSLRTRYSITQLSKKFGAPRILIKMVGVKDEEDRMKVNLRHEMKVYRRESKWSVGKVVRREEKRARRAMW